MILGIKKFSGTEHEFGVEIWKLKMANPIWLPNILKIYILDSFNKF